MIAYMVNGPLKGRHVAIERVMYVLCFADYSKLPPISIHMSESISIKDNLPIIEYRPYKYINEEMIAYVYEPKTNQTR